AIPSPRGPPQLAVDCSFEVATPPSFPGPLARSCGLAEMLRPFGAVTTGLIRTGRRPRPALAIMGLVSDCGQPSVNELDHPGNTLIWVVTPMKGVGGRQHRVAMGQAAQRADSVVEFVWFDAIARQDGPV